MSRGINGLISLALLSLAIPLVLLAMVLGWVIIGIRQLVRRIFPTVELVPEFRPGHKAEACATCTPHGHA